LENRKQETEVRISEDFALWQRDLIVSLYKVATTMAKIGGDDDGGREQTMLQEALHLTDEYAGMDRQRLIDDLNRALQQSVH
jgi:hypothetical protein